jgi:hypothetical protein
MRLLPLPATLLFTLTQVTGALAQGAAPGPAPAPAAAQPAPIAPAAEAAANPPAPAETPVAPAAPALGNASAEPAADPRVQALEQRIDELEAQQAEAQAGAEEEAQRFKIYGFLDFGLKKAFPSKDEFFAALIERKLTFVLGNINLYFDAQPMPNWRGLVEARLTNYPHGQETVAANGQFTRTNNSVFDTSSPSGRNQVIWGGVVLERAQIEHTITDLFNLRVGYFLTPYGIWNVDHGTPTLISLVLPSFQVEEAMPARQLGVQAYGATTANNLELGYSAYITNGRAPFLEDPTDGKAGGARVTATFLGDNHTLKLGASGFVGDTLEQNKVLSVGAGGVGVETTTRYRYDEWAAGGDVSLDYKKLRIRTEGLVHRVHHGDGPHEPVAFAQPGVAHPNRYEYFWYAIFAYRFGMLEPYTYTELKYVTPRDGNADLIYLPGFGLNVYFSPYAQLKAQYIATKFYRTDGDDDEATSARNFRLIDTRFVLSF